MDVCRFSFYDVIVPAVVGCAHHAAKVDRRFQPRRLNLGGCETDL